MERTQPPQAKVQDILRGFHQHRRLVTLLRTMARELERLDEDNMQLRAAVLLYREVVRRGNLERTPAKTKKAG